MQELKKSLLFALYRMYKQRILGPFYLNKLCKEYNIKYESQQQLYEAIKDLQHIGYIKFGFFQDSKDMHLEITKTGIKYMENDEIDDYLGLDAEGRYIDRRSTEIYRDIVSTNVNLAKKNTYYASNQYQIVKDKNIQSCFGVEQLVECFLQQMEKIADAQQENICMLGIFAPWGRGKSYFFNKIKEHLIKRSHISLLEKIKRYFNRETNAPIDYKIVEFNVWKYQDTPALWAYLYETICKNSLNILQRIRWFVKNIKWRDLLLFIIIASVSYGLYQILTLFGDDLHKHYIKNFIETWRIPAIWLILSSSFIYALINNPARTFSSIKKHIRRPSYRHQLGIQNEIEDMLAKLLRTVVKNGKNKKILLYIDDVDRCSADKMLSVIDSLRIVLENEKIRERLIIICSIDVEKLKQVYINHYKGIYSDIEHCEQYAREQLDKIFISSIGLSTIDLPQQISFIDKLMDVTDGISEDEKDDNTLLGINRDNPRFFTTDNSEQAVISEKEIASLMKKFLANNRNIKITPRKLRIMYYQLWTANNILSKNPNTLFSEELAMNILNVSLNYNKKNIYLDNEISSVIEMVVPY